MRPSPGKINSRHAVLSPLLVNVFFAAVIHVVLVRFSEDEITVARDLVHLEEDVVGGREVPLARVERAVWGMLYADDAGIVSTSAEGLAKMMTVIVTVLEASGLTVSAKKTDTMLLRTRDQTSTTPSLVIEAAGQRYIDRRPSSYTLAASPTKTPTFGSKSNDGSVSCGHASNGSDRRCKKGRRPRLV